MSEFILLATTIDDYWGLNTVFQRSMMPLDMTLAMTLAITIK